MIDFSERKVQGALVLGMAAIIFVSLSAGMSHAQTDGNRSENFEDLLNSTDGVIRAIRLQSDPDTQKMVQNLEDKYTSLFPEASGSLDSEIRSMLSQLKEASEPEVETVKELRDKFVEIGNSQGLSLSFTHKYAEFIILAVSIGLATTVNMVSRVVVDWEKVNSVRDKQKELQEKVKKAKADNESKKARKLERKQQEFMQENMGAMFSPMKTMIIIFIPFVIVLNLMNSTFGGWVVAWMPFNFPWPNLDLPLVGRFFKGTIASLGYFGWYLLSYFGFSQIMRKLLVPSS